MAGCGLGMESAKCAGGCDAASMFRKASSSMLRPAHSWKHCGSVQRLLADRSCIESGAGAKCTKFPSQLRNLGLQLGLAKVCLTTWPEDDRVEGPATSSRGSERSENPSQCSKNSSDFNAAAIPPRSTSTSQTSTAESSARDFATSACNSPWKRRHREWR